VRGGAIHQRVDSGNGALPAAKKKAKADKKTTEISQRRPLTLQIRRRTQNAEPETIHSRSVQWFRAIGVVAKMDLIESKRRKRICLPRWSLPVDYKAGAPKEGEEANELWDTDKMQLGLQALILRENVISATRASLISRHEAARPFAHHSRTGKLDSANIAEAKRVITGPIPAPLVHSPKCVRCSLAPVCLPTRRECWRKLQLRLT